MSHCPACQSPDLMQVRMTLKTGPVLFCSCRNCEHRWWVDVGDGDKLTLPDILERVAA
jgi:hypothetical protein